MIIKPKVRGSGARLADYLLNSKKNDHAELVETRGFHAPTLKGSFGLVEAMAEKTRCEQPFYHVSFRLAPGEVLAPEQWQACAGRLEEKLELESQPRAVVMHTQKGEQHMHVVWSRIDGQNFRAVNLFKDWPRCQETARELERELGLKQVRDRKPVRELAAPTFSEDQQARRKGQRLKEKREAIRSAWEQSEDGKSFSAALKDSGFMLAKGDKRDFVAVDERGSLYTIGKRTTGATAAQVRVKLHDLDPEKIPTIEAAREIQQQAAQKRQEQQEQAKLEHQDSVAAFKKHQLKEHEARDEKMKAAQHEAEPVLPAGTEARAMERSAGKGLRVATGIAGGVTEKLVDCVAGLLDFFAGPTPRKVTPEEYLKSAEARREYLAQKAAERARNKALDNMRQDIREKNNLAMTDVRSLSRDDLENIKAHGDAYVVALIEAREKELSRGLGGRERER